MLIPMVKKRFTILRSKLLLFHFQAAILQLTTEYITNLQQEKSKVIAQNAYFKRVLTEHRGRCNLELSLDISYGSPPTKRKKRDTGKKIVEPFFTLVSASHCLRFLRKRCYQRKKDG